MDTVLEDDGLIDRNDRLILKFDTLDKIWKKFQADKEHTENGGLPPPPYPINPFNGNEMKRVPSTPKSNQIESPRLLCGCINSKNHNPGQPDQFNSCIAKCRMRNDVNDKRHMSELAEYIKSEQFKWEGNPPG